MKRIHQVLFAIVTVVLLVSCAGKSQADEPTEPQNNPSEVVTLAKFFSGGDFDAHNAGIEDGSSLPVELWYYVENSGDVTVTDQEFMADIWKRLCAIEIDVANIDRELAILDGGSGYVFTWEDGSSFSFTFSINEYASVKGGLAPIVDPNDLRAIDRALSDYSDSQAYGKSLVETLVIGDKSFRSLDAVASDGSNYECDFDGDGSTETLFTQFVDLGDEAPSYISIEAYVAGAPHLEAIDRAYDIEEVRAYETADGGRGLAIIYSEGDYYSHDNQAACTVSWDGKELVVEYLK